MAKQLNVNLAFTADTTKAKQGLTELQKQLRELTQNSAQKSPLGLTQEIDSAIKDVTKLETALKNATSKTGTLDLGQFRQEMNKAGLTADKIAEQLSTLGPAGQQAFAQLTQSVVTAEIPLKRTSALLTGFATTLKNTARWQISSNILHGFLGSMQSAVYYAHDLNESLNNIRIVTGNSVDEMAKFAIEANKAAQALSTTTTNYTNASLIYYQQGLSESEVKERTDVTIKMANVARESAEEVSQQMTAVWNNFDDGTKSLEYYADVMTALGAATASSTDEMAEGLEKFASVADTVGLSYEYATAALATVTAQTRQSADIVGNAFKTLFARLEGLNLGETLEDGTTLNKYSEALNKVGISIKDTNGEMKSMDQILDEMGAKWDTLSKAQQIALAQTVAGVRQYTQLISLMDNWDIFQQNLGVAQGAEGALQEQADIYAESWEAARDRVTAAAEEIYNQLLNDDFFIDLNNGLAKILNTLSNVIDTLGGLKGVVPLVGTMLLKAFGSDLANSIDRAVYNLSLLTEKGKEAVVQTRMEMVNALKNITSDYGYEGNAQTQAFQIQSDLQEQLIKKSVEIESINGEISKEQQQQIQHLMDINAQLGKAYINSAKEREQQEAIVTSLKQQMSQRLSVGGDKNKFNEEARYVEELQKQYKIASSIVEKYYKAAANATKTSAEEQEVALKNIKQSLSDLKASLDAVGASYAEFETEFNTAINSTSLTELLINLDGIKTVSEEIGGVAQLGFDELERELVEAGSDANQAYNSIRGLQEAASSAGNAALQEAQDLAVLNNQTRSTSASVEEISARNMKFGESLVSISNVLMTFAMTLTTIQGIVKTLADEDMTSSEKFVSIFTSLAMILPMIISSAQALGPAITGLATSIAGAEVAAQGLLASLGAIVSAAAPWIAVIGAVAGASYAIYSAYTAETRAAQNVIKQSQNLTEEYESIQSAYDTLKETLENYQSARDALDKMTEGTLEWKDAVYELNNQVIELLGNYPGLVDEVYNENGVLTISNKGQETLLSEEERKVKQAYRGSLYGQISANNAQLALSNKDFVNSVESAILNKYGTKAFYSGSPEVSSAYISGNESLIKIFEAIDKYGNNILLNSKELAEKAEITNDEAATWIGITDESRKQLLSQYEQYRVTRQNNQFIREELGKTLIEDAKKESSPYAKILAEALGKQASDLAEDYVKNANKYFKDPIEEYAKSLGYTYINDKNIIDETTNTNVAERFDEETSKRELAYEKANKEVLQEEKIKQMEDALYTFYTNVLWASKDTAKIIYSFSDDINSLTQEEVDSLNNLKSNEFYDIFKDTFEVFGFSEEEVVSHAQEIHDRWYDAWQDISGSLVSEAADIFETLDLEEVNLSGRKTIAEQLQKAIVLGADDAVNLIQEVFKSNNNIDKQKFAEELRDINWNTISVTEFKDRMTEVGIAINKTDEELKELINSMSLSGSSFEDLSSKYAALHKIIDKLSTGDTISEEDFSSQFASEYSEFFTYMLDGTYKLTTDAKEFYNIVQNNEITKFENGIDKLKEKIEDYKSIQGENFDYLVEKTIPEQSVPVGPGKSKNSVIIDDDKIGMTKAYGGYEAQIKSLQIIKTLNSDNEEILTKVYELQQKIDEDPNRTDTYKEINELLMDCKESYENLDETIKNSEAEILKWEIAIASTYDNLGDLRDALDEGKFSIEAFNVAAYNLDKIKDLETLDSDDLEDFSEHLQDIAEISEDIEDNLSDNAAKVVAKGIMKMTDAVDILATSFISTEKNADTWSDIIMNSSRQSEEYADAIKGTAQALSLLLDISEEYVSEDFIREHLEDIALAAKGDADAIDKLKSELTEPIIAKIALDNNVTTESIKSELSKIQEWLNNEDLKVGAEIDDSAFILACNELIASSKMTVDQVNALFDSLGFEVNWANETVPTKYQVPLTTTHHHREYSGEKDQWGNFTDWTDTEEVVDSTLVDFDGSYTAFAVATDGSTPKINGVTKKASGSYNNYSSTNKGGKKAGKSSGGSSSQPDKKKRSEDKPDRYYDINNAISKVNEQLEKNSQLTKQLESYQNHYSGRTLIASLKKENDLLKDRNSILNQQYNNYEQLYAIQLQELEDLKSNIGGVWDGDVLTNYFELFQANLDKYNEAVDKYNAMSKDQQDSTGKDMLEDAKTVYDKYKKYLEDYQDLYYNKMYDTENKLADTTQQRLENQLKVIENNLKGWETEITLRLDMTKLKREWREFIKEVEKDFRKIYKNLTIESSANKDVFNTYFDDASIRINQIAEVEREIKRMDASKDQNGVVQLTDDMMFGSISEAQEYLKTLQTELVNTGNSLNELYEKIWDNYIEGLDQAADNFADMTKEVEHLTDMLEYEKEVIELLYGDEAFDLMSQYYTTQQGNIEAQIYSTRVQAEFWEDQFYKAFNMNKNKHNIDLNDMSTWTEDMKKAYEEMIESQEKLNDLIIKGIENFRDYYINNIAETLREMDRSIWGMKLDELSKDWDFIQKRANEYLDDVEGAYAIQTLANKIDKGIAEATDLKYQQKLAKLREDEITMLREKERLTQSDIDLAEARYNIALKEMALEEAQNSKTEMKLVRDTSGNWTYQYVADEEEVLNKQQELLDAYNNLYKIADEAYKHAMELAMEMYEEYKDKVKEIAEDITLSEEEKMIKIKELQDQYLPEIQAAMENAKIYEQETIMAAAATFAEVCEQDADAYTTLTDLQKELVDEVKEQHLEDYEEIREAILNNYDEISMKAKESFQEMNENSKTAAADVIRQWDKNTNDSVKGAMNEAFTALEDYTREFEEELINLERISGRAIVEEGGVAKDIDAIGTEIDEVIGLTEALAQQGSSNLETLRSFVNEVENAWDGVIGKINDAIGSIQEYLRYMESVANVSNVPINVSRPTGNPDTLTNSSSNSGSNSGEESKGKVKNTSSIEKLENNKLRSAYSGQRWTIKNSSNGMIGIYDNVTGEFSTISPSRDRSILESQVEMLNNLEISKIPYAFATGGYTGEWGTDGRLAVLHQKELVLNQDDTLNMLSAVKAIRDIAGLNESISQTIASSIGQLIMRTVAAGGGNFNSGTNNNTSNVFNITAEFPNADDVQTIRDAILSLPNLASQFVNER